MASKTLSSASTPASFSLRSPHVASSRSPRACQTRRAAACAKSEHDPEDRAPYGIELRRDDARLLRSDTVPVRDRKLKDAGWKRSSTSFEAMSHGNYSADDTAPETHQAFGDIAKSLTRNLAK